ncbi:N-acetylmuramoyl-L-alanine amidase [Bowdeniella massiliensis]|uniref:N-acetylmuramoyl-L-alanine amidase n=1 Tax=Bowdeniella massiliensis TaxID=2932264 RepID=UPI0020288EA0|nr:N-acetylmuramoyl-L-alanine amidase [Bowdeniella massiliensis]
MKLIPGAIARPISRNYTPRRRARTDAVILHVAVSKARSLHGWFNNPAAKASSHLYVRKDGSMEQYVSHEQSAWTSGAGSYRSIGIETEGMGIEPWTAAQRETIARVLAWAHKTYGVPLALMDSSAPRARGTGWHRLGIPMTRAQLSRGVSYTGGELWSRAVGKTCLPTDVTEVLTKRGWVPLLEVADTDLVASVDGAGRVSFDTAEKIEPYVAQVITVGKFESTPDHDWVVSRPGPSNCLDCDFSGKRRAVGVHRQHTGHNLKRTDQWVKVPAAKLRRADTALEVAPRDEGLPLTLDEVRMAVWLFADGHYMSENGSGYYGVEWHFKKDRKTERVTALLDRLGVAYSLGARSDGTSAIRVWGDEGRFLIDLLPTKRFTPDWLAVSREQIDAMWEELRLADGASTVPGHICFSRDKESLNVLQAASTLNGVSTRMWHTSGLWWLAIRKSRHRYEVRPPTRETEVACLTTVNGTLIIRQRGQVTVTGNCPGSACIAQIPSIVSRARIIAGLDKPKPNPSPADALAEAGILIGDTMKNVGIYTNRADGTRVYAILNPASGFFHKFTGGTGKTLAGTYVNPLAAAFDTGSWPFVTQSHMDVIEEACALVRAGLVRAQEPSDGTNKE